MGLVWQWPQITFAVFLGVELGIRLAKNGQPRTGHYTLWDQLISWALILVVLYYGGFFTEVRP